MKTEEMPLWPEPFRSAVAEAKQCATEVAPAFQAFLRDQGLPERLNLDLQRYYLPLALWLHAQKGARRPLLVGVNGAQGSGKSTLCTLLAFLLKEVRGCRCAVLSIDDLYLTRAERQKLAAGVHPLLATRGVPGTHDPGLGVRLFDSLLDADKGSTTPLPRFDKAQDDRAPREAWHLFAGRPDLIFFEGWCVGALPQAEESLIVPLNALESGEDQEGIWRRYVNQKLVEYQELFARLDLLLMLKIPAWEVVGEWRGRQEQMLAAQRSGSGVMDAAALRRFIMHYERLTRHQLDEMPQRADLVFALNREQRVEKINKKAATD